MATGEWHFCEGEREKWKMFIFDNDDDDNDQNDARAHYKFEIWNWIYKPAQTHTERTESIKIHIYNFVFFGQKELNDFFAIFLFKRTKNSLFVKHNYTEKQKEMKEFELFSFSLAKYYRF